MKKIARYGFTIKGNGHNIVSKCDGCEIITGPVYDEKKQYTGNEHIYIMFCRNCLINFGKMAKEMS